MAMGKRSIASLKKGPLETDFQEEWLVGCQSYEII